MSKLNIFAHRMLRHGLAYSPVRHTYAVLSKTARFVFGLVILCLLLLGPTTGYANPKTDSTSDKTSFTFNDDATFTVPAGVTKIRVQAWGGGGAGGNDRGTGGGGGAFATRIIDVTPGEQYTINIGQGGAGGASPQAGGNTLFSSNGSNLVVAVGGNGAGGGGLASSCTPAEGAFSGGNGGTGGGNSGGGGGGSAFSDAPGGTGGTGGGNAGGAGGAGEGPGGSGGGGNNSNGQAGFVPGGGGGGGGRNGNGAAGASGRLIILVEEETEQYTLNINIVGSGSVEISGVEYTEPITVDAGTELTLEALADADWTFDGWSGDLVSDNAIETITMDGDKDITATFITDAPIYSISGTITDGTNPIEGIEVVASGDHSQTVFTNASGEYIFTGISYGSDVTITPTPNAYTFSPEFITVNNISNDVTGQDFTGTSTGDRTISGTILDDNGDPIAGVSVVATGEHSQTVTTNSLGFYQFTGLPSGNRTITITPSLTGFTFDPESRTVNNNFSQNPNVTGQNFTGTAMTATFYSRQSGNWNDPSSWSTTSHTGAVATRAPGAEDTVIIGNGDAITLTADVTNNVSVSVNSTGTLITGNNILSGSGSFALASGATLHIGSPGGIALSGATGNIQNTGSRNFNPGASYVYNGTSAQATGNGLPVTVNNLTINNINSVSALGDLTINGQLSLTGGTLIMPERSSLVTSSVTGTGNVRMQHEVSGVKGWRMVASPIETTYADLFDGFVTQGFGGSDYPDLQPNILWFAETELGTTNMAWRSISGGGVPGGRGHFQYVFDGAGLPGNGGTYPDELPIVMTATGREHMTGSSFNFGITYTPRSAEDITDTDIPEMNSGWNLVGNPTTASLDWGASGWTRTNMDATYYVWVASANEYLVSNNLVGGGVIAPFQAFWVRASNEGAEFTMTQQVKTTGGTFAQKDGETVPPPSGQNAIVLPVKLEAAGLKTTSYIAFSETGKTGEDPYDGYRLEPMSDTWLKLYTTTTKHNDPLVINNLPPDLEEQIRIPLYVGGQIEKQPLGGSYTLRWSVPHQWPEDWGIALMDHHQQQAVSMVEHKTYQFNHQGLKTTPDNQIPFRAAGPGDSAPLKETGPDDSSQFTVPNQIVALLDNPVAKTSQDPNRFTIVITPGGAGEDPIYTPDTPALLPPYPNPARSTIHIEFNLPDNDRVIIEAFDLQGRRVATLADGQFSAGYHKLAPWTHPMLSDGIYLITLTTSSHKDHQKITIIR